MNKERELKLGMRCVKYMIFVANFMFTLVGLLLISIGYTIKSFYTEFDAFLSSQNYRASDLAIAIGIIIFVIAIFGCVGAIKESVCLVNLYALSLLAIVILEISLSIIAYTSRRHLQEIMRVDMLVSMDYYPSDTNYIWKATQYNLQCCGVDGPRDWSQYYDDSRYNLTGVSNQPITTGSSISTDAATEQSIHNTYHVPSTCCWRENCIPYAHLYMRGCLPQISLFISQSSLLLGMGATCITIIQLLGAVFAHLLAKSIRKLKTQMEVERTIRRQQLYESISKSSFENEKGSPVLYVPSSSEA